MRNNAILARLAGVALAISLLTAPAVAQTSIGFDPPVKVLEIPSRTTPPSDESPAATCFIYVDVIIYISGTEGPSPNNALVLPRQTKALPAKCNRDTPSYGVELQSGASYPSGRIGNFLVFEASDPTGASYFTVFNVRNGHQLFQDGLLGADGYLGLYGITAVKVTRGTLHMHYLRGVNTACSLLSDRDGCWAQLLSNGEIPRGVFPGPPSIETCKKSYESDPLYQRSPNPNNDPSIVSYEVDLTLDSKGNSQVRPSGALRCDPMP